MSVPTSCPSDDAVRSTTGIESSPGRILIADDDPVTLRSLERIVRRAGYQTVAVEDGLKAMSALTDDVLVALLDLRMPGLDGIECLRQSKMRYPDLQVLVVSASSEINDAVAAMRQGAFDYVAKPFEIDELTARLAQAVQAARIAREHRALCAVVDSGISMASFVAHSPAATALRERVHRVAPLDGTVLLTGESGTGKSTVARMIHQLGPRASGPFIAVNCASLPRDLIETELFGHARGAFTGAVKDRPGRAEIAHGGTLFLDEIGDLPLELQPKLLSFLQEKVVQRIGSNESRRVDVRLIAATHQDLTEMCRQRRFRQDLFYRLNVLGLTVPSLRERIEDLPELAQQILDRISRHREGRPQGISPEAIRQLQAYSWPGNVREFENLLERAAAFCNQPQIDVRDLAGLMFEAQGYGRDDDSKPDFRLAGLTMDEIERRAIIDTLEACGGNKARAARELGLSEKTIYNKMRRLEIDRAQWSSRESRLVASSITPVSLEP